MNPMLKYTLGRVGLFAAVFLVLWPLDLNVFVKALIALLASAGLSFFLLRHWRDEVANRLAEGAEKRRAQREQLRAALDAEADESTRQPRDS